jgi:hypothetical protein
MKKYTFLILQFISLNMIPILRAEESPKKLTWESTSEAIIDKKSAIIGKWKWKAISKDVSRELKEIEHDFYEISYEKYLTITSDGKFKFKTPSSITSYGGTWTIEEGKLTLRDSEDGIPTIYVVNFSDKKHLQFKTNLGFSSGEFYIEYAEKIND